MGGYVSILFLFSFAITLAASILILSSLINPRSRAKTDLSPYECGISQASNPKRPLSVRFFVIAILFLIFDVEVALLYPWALVFREFAGKGLGVGLFLEGGTFLLILLISLFYIFRAGLFDWGEKKTLQT